MSRALRYFSTACWQKKQAASATISFRRRKICEATLKSFSAFLTHSRVIGFIHNFSSSGDVFEEIIPPSYSLRDFGWGSYQKVEGKIPVNGVANPYRHPFSPISSPRKDHEQIHIRVLCRISIGVGTEEDDLLRLDLFHHAVA